MTPEEKAIQDFLAKRGATKCPEGAALGADGDKRSQYQIAAEFLFKGPRVSGRGRSGPCKNGSARRNAIEDHVNNKLEQKELSDPSWGKPRE